MALTFPITLQAIPATTSITFANFNELMTYIAQYLAGSVSANVSFFEQGAVDPTTDQGVIFYNTAQNVFKYWDVNAGEYLPIGFLFVAADPTSNSGYIFNTTQKVFKYWNGTGYSVVTQYKVGDVKQTFISGDDVANGWVLCDGRQISTLGSLGLSTAQTAALNGVFPSGYLTNAIEVGYGALPGLNPVTYITSYGAASSIPSIGLFLLNGATIATLVGASAAQKAQLTAFFGATLPNVTPSGSPTQYFLVATQIYNDSANNAATYLKVFCGYP